jgi:hypothetical protein
VSLSLVALPSLSVSANVTDAVAAQSDERWLTPTRFGAANTIPKASKSVAYVRYAVLVTRMLAVRSGLLRT